METEQAKQKAVGAKPAQITEQEVKELRHEILQQEALIRGYQVHIITYLSTFSGHGSSIYVSKLPKEIEQVLDQQVVKRHFRVKNIPYYHPTILHSGSLLLSA